MISRDAEVGCFGPASNQVPTWGEAARNEGTGQKLSP